MAAVARLCVGCDEQLPAKHLRTQLAPPDNKWHEVRTHDLICLMNYLEREAVAQADIFTNPAWVDSRG